jgi:hypothetical protein
MTHTITLVGDVYVSKTEALERLSGALGQPIDYSEPADPTIILTNGVVVSIEVPKFGEDLPLTVDLTADNLEALKSVAPEIIDAVQANLRWSLRIISQAVTEQDNRPLREFGSSRSTNFTP